MKTRLTMLGVCLLMTLGVCSAESVLEVTDKSKDLRLFTTSFFELQAPSSLLYQVDKNGASLHFEASYRQSMAGFAIALSPLGSVNGYKTKWTNLAGYFKFINQPFKRRKVGFYEWAYLETKDQTAVDRSFFVVHEGRWVQVSYRYPTNAQEEYGTMFEDMLASIKLKR